MAQDCTNVLMGGATVWYAAVGTAEPDETTINYGASWGASWTEVGVTGGPLIWGVTTNVIRKMVEQRVRPVKVRVSSMEEAFETSLAEVTAANLALASTGTAPAPTAASSGQKGFEEFEAGSNDFSLTERAWGFEGEFVDSAGVSQPVRVFIERAVSYMNGNLEWSRESEDGTNIPLRVEVVDDCEDTDPPWTFQRVTADAV
jgi:hypothetical protein